MKIKILLMTLMTVLVFSTVNVQALWIIGRSEGSLCNIIPGSCGLRDYATLGMPKAKFEAIRAGQFVLLDEEPKTDVAAQVDVKIERGKMIINILKLKGTEKFFFDLKRDTPLDAESAKSLGFRSVIVKKGSYSTCYTTGKPNGTTILDVVAR